jgi:chaperonin GroEL
MDMLDAAARSIVMHALQAPFIKILKNSGIENWWDHVPTKSSKEVYDAKNYKTVDAFESGIIDPAKVVITALKNAASVAGTILTTENVVFEKEDKGEKPQNPMAGMM